MPELTTRRKLLTTTAVAGAAALAGCGGGGGGSGSGTGSSAAFKSVEIDGEQLVVQLTESAVEQVAAVSVVGPDGGSSLGEQGLEAGVSRVTFDLLTQYTPGEHTVVAVGGEGNEIASTTQRLEPDVEFQELITYDEVSDDGYQLLGYRTPLLELTNTGNAPAKLSHIELDNVPSPTMGIDYKKRREDVTGIVDKQEEAITVINPGQTVAGQVKGGPLYFGYDSPFECGTTEEATLTVGYQGGTEKFNISIRYAEQEGDSTNCNITVVDQS